MKDVAIGDVVGDLEGGEKADQIRQHQADCDDRRNSDAKETGDCHAEHRQHAAVDEQKQSEHCYGSPVHNRCAQTGDERGQRACVVKDDQRGREPECKQGWKRAQHSEQHRELYAAVVKQLVAWRLPTREQPDQHSAVDDGRRSEREAHAEYEDDAERKQRPEVAPKSAEQIGQTRSAAALLRPRRGEKADREHRLQHRCSELSERRPRAELGQRRQEVIRDQQHQPGKRSSTKHRVGSAQPENTLECVATCERDRSDSCAHESGNAASLLARSRKMRSNVEGSCACVSSPGRGRWRSYSRDSQKRSAAARSRLGHCARSSKSSGMTRSYAVTSALVRSGSSAPAKGPSEIVHQSLTVIATSYARASVAAKPKSMMPDTWPSTNRTLSQKRSPWIAPCGNFTLADALWCLSSAATSAFCSGERKGRTAPAAWRHQPSPRRLPSRPR